MNTTVILRFRDLLVETIPEHKTMIDQAGYVWWGWWRKPNEPTRLSELAELSGKSGQEPFEIGLYDRSRSVFFSATLAGCVFSDTGDFIASPEPTRTPIYYRTAKLPAWLKLLRITELNQDEFVRRFVGIPIDDHTFFPVTEDKTGNVLGTSDLIGDPVPLRGNTIVHLSDLHFGSDFGYPPTTRPGVFPLLGILENDIKKEVGSNVGMLVVSGDITTRGDASHLFNTGRPFLHELRGKLGLNQEQVVIIPGNHDISFKEFALTYDHEAAFNEFLTSFYGAPREQMQLLRFILPSGRLVEVLTINSIKLRSTETSNYGWVDWQTYETFLDAIPPSETGSLRIAVIHHHLVPALREERLPDLQYPYGGVSVTLNAATVVEGLQKYGFRVVFNGHQHTPALNRISRGRPGNDTLEMEGLEEPLYLIAGGSAGVMASRIDGDIRDNTYGLLSIEDNHLRLRVRQFNTSGNVRPLYSATLPL